MEELCCMPKEHHIRITSSINNFIMEEVIPIDTIVVIDKSIFFSLCFTLFSISRLFIYTKGLK